MTGTEQSQAGELCQDCRGTGRIEYLAWEHAIFEGDPEPPTVKKSIWCPFCGGEGVLRRGDS